MAVTALRGSALAGSHSLMAALRFSPYLRPGAVEIRSAMKDLMPKVALSLPHRNRITERSERRIHFRNLSGELRPETVHIFFTLTFSH